jgi:hypothetical protein
MTKGYVVSSKSIEVGLRINLVEDRDSTCHFSYESNLRRADMLSIELLKRRGVCLWAYARSQTILESMIHEAERLIDRLELISEKRSGEIRAGRERVIQWDWEVRSQLSLLFRPAQPVLEAFQGFPLAIKREQSLRQQVQTLCDGVAIRLEYLRLLLRHMDEFSVARLSLARRRRMSTAQLPGSFSNEQMS